MRAGDILALLPILMRTSCEGCEPTVDTFEAYFTGFYTTAMYPELSSGPSKAT
jgi:hypothetical protein